MGGGVQVLKGTGLRRETRGHAMPCQPSARYSLLEYRREQRVCCLARRRNEYWDKSLRGPGIEEGLVTGGVDAVHRDPAWPLPLDPYGGIPRIRGIPVYAERDHPASLGRQMIEIALMLGGVNTMICFEHAISFEAGWFSLNRGTIETPNKARIDVSILI